MLNMSKTVSSCNVSGLETSTYNKHVWLYKQTLNIYLTDKLLNNVGEKQKRTVELL